MTAESTRYLSLIPAGTTKLHCSGAAHRLRWAAGQLTALDHDDPDGEPAVSGHGGARKACVDLLDAWERRRTDLRVLVLTSRGPADPLGWEQPRSTRAGRRGPRLGRGRAPAPYGSAFPAGDGELEDYLALLALGSGFPDRLAASVAAHWSDRLDAGEAPEDAGPALRAALTGRAWLALRSWARDPHLKVDVSMTDPSALPGLRRDGDGIAATLPFRWLLRVWAPGLAITAGRFVLAADRRGDALELTAADVDGHTSTMGVPRP